MIEHGKRLLAVEVKSSPTVRLSDTDSLTLFLKEYPETLGGVLVYSGSEIRRLHEKIVAVPWHLLG